MASKTTFRVFGAAITTFVLFSGCDGSTLKSRQADGGLGGSGGVLGSGGSGVGGTSANGGTSGHGGAGGGTLALDAGPTDARPDSSAVDVQADARPDLSAVEVQADARLDLSAVDVQADARPDSSAVDVPAEIGTGTSFIDQMDGIWLVGWMGDMNHFSWVRIRVVSPGLGAGTADFLAGDDLAINSPYWQCSGLGKFLSSEKPNSILFTFPTSCPSSIQREYTFDRFREPGTYPKGAILSATVTPLSGGSALQGYKFPDTQCSADMTTCSDPL